MTRHTISTHPPLNPLRASTDGPREVVAILNTGGTFSATTALADDDVRNTSLPDWSSDALYELLMNNLDRHFYSRHGMTRKMGYRPRGVAIQWWKGLPDDIILSENATPSYWLRLAELISEHVSNCTGTVVGIIIIHGTDTVSSAAAALSFLFSRLSMPIVFVAANRPLMNDHGQDRRLSSYQSDAWPNLLLALHFILVCGRTYRQVALSFDGHIHYPLNLRKLSESRGHATPSAMQYDAALHTQGYFVQSETFKFRNILMLSPFLLRDIGGELCQDSLASWPPIRTNDTERNVAEMSLIGDDTSRFLVDTVIEHLHATSSHRYSAGDDPAARVVLVNTYASGTIPTDARHELTRRLGDCAGRQQVIVLTGPYGIDLGQCYDHDNLAARGIRCLRIGPVIPETALPLVAITSAMEVRQNEHISRKALEQRLKERVTNMLLDLHMITTADSGPIVDTIGAAS